MTIGFDQEVAVVTGAGRGLGRGYALELAARGARVVCNDLDGEAAAATAGEIVDHGGSAISQSSSVATPEGGAAIIDAAIDAFGSVEIVVNNAGQLRNAAFEDLTADDFHDVVRTHLGGAFHVTQPAYRHMKAAGYGRIVFTSSSAGMFGSPWQANYAAAKAGITGLCNVVALEGEAHGIKANVVMPMALTTIGDHGGPPFPPDLMRETVRAISPLAPRMTVDNVVPLVVYLASRRCAPTRCAFSVGAGHVARVFVGVSPGWYAHDDADVAAEAIEAQLDAILDLAGFATPGSMNDECRFIAESIPGDARA